MLYARHVVCPPCCVPMLRALLCATAPLSLPMPCPGGPHRATNEWGLRPGGCGWPNPSPSPVPPRWVLRSPHGALCPCQCRSAPGQEWQGQAGAGVVSRPHSRCRPGQARAQHPLLGVEMICSEGQSVHSQCTASTWSILCTGVQNQARSNVCFCAWMWQLCLHPNNRPQNTVPRTQFEAKSAIHSIGYICVLQKCWSISLHVFERHRRWGKGKIFLEVGIWGAGSNTWTPFDFRWQWCVGTAALGVLTTGESPEGKAPPGIFGDLW